MHRREEITDVHSMAPHSPLSNRDLAHHTHRMAHVRTLTMTINLNQCPCCRWSAEGYSITSHQHYVVCINPDCALATPTQPTMFQAAAIWNKRIPAPKEDVNKIPPCIPSVFAQFDRQSCHAVAQWLNRDPDALQKLRQEIFYLTNRCAPLNMNTSPATGDNS